ncbi:cell division protein FtsL [Shimwellia blattae]|uniref:Cell division protein FtsL n=1 Tax=Shimwellia blattae (strain ATCC 29907 / DSM 4481 / JCM 1650 / NBRC 105725 / CDC 9005-74) TaxID=630626 RepID=I2BCT2_SHIBC|nr:cell division protein FtsL [Shimwellia blattae]AFJ48336.1 cell division protein FtsL [Shimwellia blattae DSM 4481 = NBRC 105725]GAB81030.1 cell division protein FtsL [Shimwellia blattae DSM 4481 = NBRC 105725]VDY65830.1 Cell division protein FtsL [Shimwellia blattae]VEC25935.1 Cell division protein FtsL [Shimwellia blattae]
MIGRVTETLSRVKGSLGSSERHALPGVIGSDLLRHGKLPLCLFIAIILTAVFVVTTAHHTRLLTAQREQLVVERDALDIEWRNLILEENALGDHSRVERIANDKLQMQHVDPSQENIVVQQ